MSKIKRIPREKVEETFNQIVLRKIESRNCPLVERFEKSKITKLKNHTLQVSTKEEANRLLWK
jgi:hypothetical protein